MNNQKELLQIDMVEHPDSKELREKENIIRRIAWVLVWCWDILFFFAACFTFSVVAERARYYGSYVSDYRCFIFNLFGANIPVDPAKNFFASPFMIFVYVLMLGFLGTLAILLISDSLISGLQAKRLALNETFRTRVLIEHIRDEKLVANVEETIPTEN